MIKECIFFFLLFININSRIIIPFKYIPTKQSNLQIPKEIMTKYMSESIYINIEIGSPKQEIQIPIKFDENILYIQDYSIIKDNKITNKIFDNTKSNTFKTISESIEQDSEHDFDFFMFQNCSDIFYFLENIKKNKYHKNTEFIYRHVIDGASDLIGGFGLQIYPPKGAEIVMPCPLKFFKEKNIINNYVWSIYFTKEGNNNGDEGYLLLGDYPDNIDYNLGYYDPYEFDKNNFRTLLDYSNQKTMNYEIQMNEIYFYGKRKKKDDTNQHFFNDLYIDDFIKDIVIPQVSVYYVTKFDYNFGGILIPEYFKVYLEEKIFDTYIKEGNCFREKTAAGNTPYFFYCKNEKIIIKNIKDKIPTIIFIQERLQYNFTLNINELTYEKDDYVYFLLFYSTIQKNKWTLGKPFLKKYPFIFNPDTKDIGFYSSFLLTGVKFKTVLIITIFISVVFIIIGLLIGRKKYKINKIKKQQALEMTNNTISNSYYKSIEMNENNLENKLYN